MGGDFVRKSNGVAASAVILGGKGEISRWWLQNQRRVGQREVPSSTSVEIHQESGKCFHHGNTFSSLKDECILSEKTQSSPEMVRTVGIEEQGRHQ
ncbi:hypothetical protein FF1_043575 [Malus domestica]